MAPSKPARERLDSWKEIATYLGRDLRTVRRWEKEKGLPVHRVPGGARQAVFSYSDEIDAWLQRADTPSPGLREDLNADPIPITQPNHPLAEFSAWWSKPVLTLRRVSVGVLTLLLALAASSVLLLRSRPHADLDHVGFSSSGVQGWSAGGKLLWSYSFGRPLQEEERNVTSRIQILATGKEKQVLVMAPFVREKPDSTSDTLYTFSSDGKLLWRHDFLDAFRFDGNTYGAPWLFGNLLVTADGEDPAIWTAVNSVFWTPSSLLKLDVRGRRIGQFVNWGHIHALANFRNAAGSFVLVGGINNDCSCAMLAVLKEDEPYGVSPHLGPSSLNCENCPSGRPYRYLLFPRSELAAATDFTYNEVSVILSDDGRVRVGTKETKLGNGPLGADWDMYELSSDFVPQSFEVSDHLLELHRQLEVQGKLRHSIDRCPELNSPKSIRIWSPQEGWKSVAIPLARQASKGSPRGPKS